MRPFIAGATVTTYDFNLFVIGGGPAGEKGACQVAYFGLPESVIPASCAPRGRGDFRVAIAEKAEHFGGSCVNTGTLPSKTLRESSLFLSGAKTRQLSGGLHTEVKRTITLADFMQRAHMVEERERERIARNLDRHGVQRFRGFARVLDPHTVEVEADDGAKHAYSTEFILIATGSSPARPPSIPFNSENVFDSDTVLQMKHLPKSMTVIGGGVIGSEYACLFQALGIRVTLVNRSDRPLEFLDREIIDTFVATCTAAGMTTAFQEEIESCETDGKEVVTRLKSGKTLRSETLLYAAGRGGNTGGLGLEALGIPIGRFGNIEKVDPRTYQTTVPGIYAAGDVIGRPALASTSMEQGRLAMCHAFNIHYRGENLNPVLPAGIYTIPEISMVGESEDSIKAKNAELAKAGEPEVRYVVGRSRFGDHARGHIIGDTTGMVKLIFSAPEGDLLGCHVIGENASELVHIGMTHLQFKGNVTSIINTVFNYPTLSDVYKYAAYDALGKLNQVRAAAS